MENDRDGLHLNRCGLLESGGKNVALQIRLQLILFGESAERSKGVGDIGTVDPDLQVVPEQ